MKTFASTQDQNPQLTGQYATVVAIVSFIIGTLFFVGFKWSHDNNLLIAGFIYVILAAFTNSIVLIHLLWLIYSKPIPREDLVIRMLILLSNIPIAFFYFSTLFNPTFN